MHRETLDRHEITLLLLHPFGDLNVQIVEGIVDSTALLSVCHSIWLCIGVVM